MRQFFFLLLLFTCTVRTGQAGTEFFFATITLDEAARNVMQRGKSKVLGTRTVTMDGKKVHVIKVLTPEGRIQHIKIDAESGRRMR